MDMISGGCATEDTYKPSCLHHKVLCKILYAIMIQYSNFQLYIRNPKINPKPFQQVVTK